MVDHKQLTAGPIVTSLLAGMAGAMAWGIRGQYGHETGAMIAGVLIGFTLVMLHANHLTALKSARAVAMFALGVSVGGSMTYGQTVGLTHDAMFVGNNEAYFWGMLGLAIKGGIWISLGAAMFGMALSDKRHLWRELLIVLMAMIFAQWVGWKLLNQPFDKAEGIVPKFYFSHYDYWAAKQDKPRPECWGGLLCSLGVFLTYLGAVKRDRFALSLGLWGLVGGAIGFPAGQALQSYNAWHGEWISSLPTSGLTKYFNWWNLMETTFGFVMGSFVGFGCWLHRQSIKVEDEAESRWFEFFGFLMRALLGMNWLRSDSFKGNDVATERWFRFRDMSPALELILLLVHVWLLVAWNFQSIDWVDAFADRALPMIVIPTICVMSGRYWPFLMSLPIVMIPIAGKTLRSLHFEQQITPALTAWSIYVVFPLVAVTLVAIGFAKLSSTKRRSLFAPVSLIATAWLYFYLNNAFFHSPWWWKEEWTGRTIHGAIFFACASCLALAALVVATQNVSLRRE